MNPQKRGSNRPSYGPRLARCLRGRTECLLDTITELDGYLGVEFPSEEDVLVDAGGDIVQTGPGSAHPSAKSPTVRR
jgi:hypothetical protein